MGTHNLLLSLGDSMFLEVIAPDPKAKPPGRPRWFALDSLGTNAPASLSTWVARTSDIGASNSACSEMLGEIEPMSRGAFNWLMSVTADGALCLDGIAPALIEWQTQTHPAAKLKDHGLTLAKLELVHPDPERVSRLLHSIGLLGPVVVTADNNGQGSPRLIAHISASNGENYKIGV